MALAAYALTAALHGAALRTPTMQAPRLAPEALAMVTRANASRYAKEAARQAHSALMAGNTPAALRYLTKARQWQAYAHNLTPKEA